MTEWIEATEPGTLFAILSGYIVIAWMVMLWYTGGSSGWRKLARRYPALSSRAGKRLWIGHLGFRRFAYRNLVMLKAGESHLHFQMIARLGHPPFSVPWSEISTARQPHWWWSSLIRLTFAGEPDVSFKVLGRDGDRIIAASGGRLASWSDGEPRDAGGR